MGDFLRRLTEYATVLTKIEETRVSPVYVIHIMIFLFLTWLHIDNFSDCTRYHSSCSTGSLSDSVPDVDFGSDSESEGSSNFSEESFSESEDDAEAQWDDMSTKKLQSGSDLTAQEDPSAGRLLDDWYGTEELDDITGCGDDEAQTDSERESNWADIEN